MTTINGQLWQRCVDCETLVPAALRTFAGLCPDCAPAPEAPAEEIAIAAGDVGELNIEEAPA